MRSMESSDVGGMMHESPTTQRKPPSGRQISARFELFVLLSCIYFKENIFTHQKLNNILIH
jgi:hypothetical protein